jgi:two-component system chemotaxis response regulator CheB
VLVVDDSPLIQHRVVAMLAGLPGVDVVGTAANVEAAIAQVEALRPDVIVLDVELEHGGKGLTVVKHVMREHGETQVIALSNFTWQAMREAYLQAGVKAYFDKALEFESARDWVAQYARTH